MKKTTLFISALMTCTLLASSGIYTADELNTDYGHIENDFTGMTPEIASAYLSVIDELSGHIGCDATEDAAEEYLHGGFIRDWDADGTPELCLLLRTSPREDDSWDGMPVYGWYPPTLYLYTYQDGQAVRAGECDLYFGTAGREAAVIALAEEDGMKYVWWDRFAPEEETTEPEEPVEEITEPESISYEKTIELKVDLTKVKSMIAVMKQIKENAKAGLSTMLKTIYDAYSAKLNALMKIVAEESAYSVQYMLLGKGCEAQMLYLNELLAEMAETNDATFVDVYYGVSNEQNLDPHPLASGHKEIADVMNDVLFDLTEAQIDEIAGGEEELQPLVNNSTISKTEIKLGEKLKIRAVAEGGAGDYQYEVYYKKANSAKWSRVHDYSYLYAFNITPATATQYEVRINVKDKNGEVETKILTFDVVK